jgi:hypothetical protein
MSVLSRRDRNAVDLHTLSYGISRPCPAVGWPPSLDAAKALVLFCVNPSREMKTCERGPVGRTRRRYSAKALFAPMPSKNHVPPL